MEPLAASTREEEPGIGGSTRLRQPFAIPAPQVGSARAWPAGTRWPAARACGVGDEVAGGEPPGEAGTRWPAASLGARPAGSGRMCPAAAVRRS